MTYLREYGLSGVGVVRRRELSSHQGVVVVGERLREGLRVLLVGERLLRVLLLVGERLVVGERGLVLLLSVGERGIRVIRERLLRLVLLKIKEI